MMTRSINQAVLFHQSGDFQAAELIYISLLQDSTDKKIRYLLGLLYSQTRQYNNAISQLEQTLPLHINNGDLFNALAICYQKTGHSKTAERLINKAIAINQDNATYYNRKSKILLSSEKILQCIDNSLLCIAKHPDFVPAYLTCVTAYVKQHRPDNGLRVIKKACRRFPNNPELAFGLAEAYLNVGNYIKSKFIFETLLKSNFKQMECLNNLGNIERDYRSVNSARIYYNKSENLSPDNPVIQLNISLLTLLEGNYKSGWDKYDARLGFRKEQNSLRNIPTWKGENLKGRSILILSEQGLGDEILFATSFNSIINQAKMVTIQCDPRLITIFRNAFPDATLVQNNAPLTPLKTNQDYKIYAGSIYQYIGGIPLPQEFIKPGNTEPAFKNIMLDNKKLNIGFSWKGATNYKDLKKRSTHLRDWKSLLSNKRYNFYCLQHNISNKDKELLSSFSSDITFTQSISKDNNIDQLITLISKLDLVISVINTNVHIAGGLGKKVWCLTPHNPDWPWGLTGKKCEWYKSVSIVRKQNSSWKSAFSIIEKELDIL